ncbi:MAG: hypothetical protein JXB36_02485 [Gammaproteobacteria bacterium]|nr:hypothetical protein [Gammaproteobacteria bacterium]
MRLRLSRTELERLAETGATEDRARFGAGAQLIYRVSVRPEGDLRATFTGDTVSVALPQPLLQRWLEPDQVSLRAEQPLESGERLTILVEKDFACLAPRPDEDDSDLFPNPGAEPR